MSRTFFISDTHFGHKNILKFCAQTRPFKTIEEHDQAIIRNWQAQVRPEDHVYHLGDVAFCNEQSAFSILSQLPGQKHLVWGNHDKVVAQSQRIKNLFVEIENYREISIQKQKIVLFHFPIYEWNKMHHGSFHFYGHVHGNSSVPGRAQDVGVDPRGGDMMLWSWEELFAKLKDLPARTHHGKTKEDLIAESDTERYYDSRSQKV